MGASLLANLSQRQLAEPMSHWPRDFFSSSNYYFALHAAWHWSDMFVELSILDYYIDVLLRNPGGRFSNSEGMSLGIGLLL